MSNNAVLPLTDDENGGGDITDGGVAGRLENDL